MCINYLIFVNEFTCICSVSSLRLQYSLPVQYLLQLLYCCIKIEIDPRMYHQDASTHTIFCQGSNFHQSFAAFPCTSSGHECRASVLCFLHSAELIFSIGGAKDVFLCCTFPPSPFSPLLSPSGSFNVSLKLEGRL